LRQTDHGVDGSAGLGHVYASAIVL
jgi:hypothetical protein